jgi:hypothetical protein
MTNNVPERRGPGRPSKYTREIADEICERISNGETLKGICRDEHMPPNQTVINWALDDRDGFSGRYAQAREVQVWGYFDDIVDIAEDGSNDWMERESENGNIQIVLNSEHVQRSRLRVDTRKWIMSKILWRTFGDRKSIEPPAPEMKITTPKRDKKK